LRKLGLLSAPRRGMVSHEKKSSPFGVLRGKRGRAKMKSWIRGKPRSVLTPSGWLMFVELKERTQHGVVIRKKKKVVSSGNYRD